MAKPLSLVGNRYGKLTVISRAENNKNGNTMWLCKCDCGSEKLALGYDLTHGRTTSCGCQKGNPQEPSAKRCDLTGKRFGNLTVKRLNNEKTKNGILVWDCVCDCGTIKSVRGGNLKSGHIKSCGCLRKNNHPSGFIDLTGMKFGRLTVIKENGRIRNKVAWLCKCNCGKEIVVIGDYLKTGERKSCGCLAKESRKVPHNVKHGRITERIYSEWSSMKTRCKETYHGRKNYFDKGIRVCDEWEKDFATFHKWAMENGYNDSLTLDRKDNSKGYNPNNCRWVTMKEQQNNRTNNINIEYNGKTQTLKQWCEEFKLDYGMVKARHQRGIVAPKLFEPKRKNQYQ